MNKRTGASIIILLAIIFLPYWIYLPLFFATVVFFPIYWEGILLGFLVDILYGRGITAFPSVMSPVAFSIMIIIVILMPLRSRLRFNSSNV